MTGGLLERMISDAAGFGFPIEHNDRLILSKDCGEPGLLIQRHASSPPGVILVIVVEPAARAVRLPIKNPRVVGKRPSDSLDHA